MGRIAIVLVVLLMGAYLCAEKQAARESSAQTLSQGGRGADPGSSPGTGAGG